MKSIWFSLLIVAGAVVGARGQQPRTDINPALVNYRALIMAPDLNKADRDYLFTNDWRGQNIPARVGELLVAYNQEFNLLNQAAQMKAPCDWGIDLSMGPDTLLPHLARCKAVAVAAKIHVQWHLQNNQEAKAVDELIATLTLGRNASRDRTIISGLVQFAIEAIVYSSVAENFGQFSPSALNQLINGFDAAPVRGAILDCIPVEKACFVDWMLNRIAELQKRQIQAMTPKSWKAFTHTLPRMTRTRTRVQPINGIMFLRPQGERVRD